MSPRDIPDTMPEQLAHDDDHVTPPPAKTCSEVRPGDHTVLCECGLMRSYKLPHGGRYEG